MPTPEVLRYFFEALKARPELVTRPMLRSAIPGAVAGGLYDVYKQHGSEEAEKAPHDWAKTLKRVGAGTAIGMSLGGLYGLRNVHGFGGQQRKLDRLFGPDTEEIYHQALDNDGADWTSNRHGNAPSTEESGRRRHYFSNVVNTHGVHTEKSKLFDVNQVGPRAFALDLISPTSGGIKDIAGRHSGVLVTLNAPHNADAAWVDAQIDRIKSHQDHILKGLDPKTSIPDEWRTGQLVSPETLEHARHYLKERLRIK